MQGSLISGADVIVKSRVKVPNLKKKITVVKKKKLKVDFLFKFSKFCITVLLTRQADRIKNSSGQANTKKSEHRNS